MSGGEFSNDRWGDEKLVAALIHEATSLVDEDDLRERRMVAWGV